METSSDSKTYAINYLISNVDLSNYLSSDDYDEYTEVCTLLDIFKNEACYLTKDSVKHWIQGLPSTLTVAFITNEIIEIVKSWDSSVNEDDADDFYWETLASSLYDMFLSVGE